MSMSELSNRIREAREAKGWSQRDLAQRMEVSQQTVAHWEQGGVPRGKRLDKLSEVLGRNLLGHGMIEPLDRTAPNQYEAFLRARTERSLIGGAKPQPLRTTNALADPSRSRGAGMASFLMTTDQSAAEKKPGAPQTDANGNFIDPGAPQAAGDKPKEESYKSFMERIRQIHSQRIPGPRGLPIYAHPDDHAELRMLRDEAFKQALFLLNAQGKHEAVIQLGNRERRIDYLSNSVIAGLMGVHTPDPLTFHHMRYNHLLVRLAVAKATRPELESLLILVVEAGDVEQHRLVLERLLGFDCQTLRVNLRVVDSYEAAAEVIVNMEHNAPLLATMAAREDAEDDFTGDGTIDPMPEY